MKKSVRCLSLCMLVLILVSMSGLGKKNRLNGVWIPVKQEMGGKPLPAAFFEKQQMTISDSTYVVVAESTDKGIIRCTGNKMDIYGKEGINAGKHFAAIYKLEKGQLTICYDLTGAAYPTAFETTGESMRFLSVFKRQGIK